MSRSASNSPTTERISIVDTHAHLDDERFAGEVEAVLERAAEQGVRCVITVGSDIPSSEAAVALANEHAIVYAAVGIHPHEAKGATSQAYDRLAELWAEPKVVAIGEIGLDFHYDNSPRDVQEDVFRHQLRLAKELGAPIAIHTREAEEATLRVLEEEGLPDAGGEIHCFHGSEAMANRAIQLGLYLAFGGMVTFKKFEELRRVAAGVPLDRMLVETDAPYLAPEPRRGRRNEPAYTQHVVQKLAEVRGLDASTVAAATTNNARELYGIVPE